MLLWDHSVRRLMHTSPPWDVPQASPSAINQAFRSRDATLNPKLHLVPITSPFSSPKSSHFAHFFFLDLYAPSLTLTTQLINNSAQLNSTQIATNDSKLFLNRPTVTSKTPKSSQTRPVCFEFNTTRLPPALFQSKCLSTRLQMSTHVSTLPQLSENASNS